MPTINKPQKKMTCQRGNAYSEERRRVYATRRWRSLRLYKLDHSPLCEMCEREGRVRAAVDVHHRVSFMITTDPDRRCELAYDYDNLMSLCKECHQKIHNAYVPTSNERKSF